MSSVVSGSVLDASAVLALLNQEPGADLVAAALADGAAISAVNLAEVVGRLAEAGMAEDLIRQALDPLGLEVVSLDAAAAYRTGLLRPATKQAGLSLGDRSCLALAQILSGASSPATSCRVLTSDRAWASLSVGVRVEVIR